MDRRDDVHVLTVNRIPIENVSVELEDVSSIVVGFINGVARVVFH